MVYPRKNIQTWIDENLRILLENFVITRKYTCKLCDASVFAARDHAELHVKIHSNLNIEDLFKQAGTRYVCKICKAFLDSTKVQEHYPVHRALYERTQHKSPLLRHDEFPILETIMVCNICQLKITASKLMNKHIMEKHADCFRKFCNTFGQYLVKNEIDASNDTDKPSKAATSTPTRSVGKTTNVKARNKNMQTTVDGNSIVVRHLLQNVGITDQSKTSGLRHYTVNVVPRYIYCCCFCPHEIFLNQIKMDTHMHNKHEITDRMIYTTKVPIELLLETPEHKHKLAEQQSIIIKCPCQYTSFSKELLSREVLNKIYYKMMKYRKNNPYLNASDHAQIDAKIKLSRIYKVQFTCHSRSTILIKNFKHPRKFTKHYVVKGKISKQHVVIEKHSKRHDAKEINDKVSNNELQSCIDNDVNKNKSEDKAEREKNYINCDVMCDEPDQLESPNPIDHIPIQEENAVSSKDGTESETCIEEQNSDNNLIVTRDFLPKIGFNCCRETRVQSRVVNKIPYDLYSCFLCPHAAIFSSEELKSHMNDKHKLVEGYSKLISVVVTESLIESRVTKDDHVELYLTCICQKSLFTKEVLTLSIIENIYRHSVTERRLETFESDDGNVNIETMLLHIYENHDPNHNVHTLIVKSNSKGLKRMLDTENENERVKLCKK